MFDETAMTAAIAMSLYVYNVNKKERACALFNYFTEHCLELDELERLVDSPNWATEMPYPTAKVYLMQAFERYRMEAAHRVLINMGM